jgi:hypothetical protein
MYKNIKNATILCTLLSSLPILLNAEFWFKQLPTETVATQSVPLSVPAFLNPTQLPTETVTTQSVPLSVPAFLQPIQLPTETVTNTNEKPSKRNQPLSNTFQKEPTKAIAATKPLVKNSTTNTILIAAGGGLATLAAIAYVVSTQFQESAAYKNLYNLIANLEEQISQQGALLSNEQLQNFKNAIEIARNQLSESAQDDEKLTLAYQALMLEAQKYSAIVL